MRRASWLTKNLSEVQKKEKLPYRFDRTVTRIYPHDLPDYGERLDSVPGMFEGLRNMY